MHLYAPKTLDRNAPDATHEPVHRVLHDLELAYALNVLGESAERAERVPALSMRAAMQLLVRGAMTRRGKVGIEAVERSKSGMAEIAFVRRAVPRFFACDPLFVFARTAGRVVRPGLEKTGRVGDQVLLVVSTGVCVDLGAGDLRNAPTRLEVQDDGGGAHEGAGAAASTHWAGERFGLVNRG